MSLYYLSNRLILDRYLSPRAKVRWMMERFCLGEERTKWLFIFLPWQVRHQVAYLGLVENVRVRRAGFASRQRYDRFLKRYKMLSQYTWPNFRGDSTRDAVMVLARDLQLPDVQFGHTKLFIRYVWCGFHSTLLCNIINNNTFSIPIVMVSCTGFSVWWVPDSVIKKLWNWYFVPYIRLAFFTHFPQIFVKIK